MARLRTYHWQGRDRHRQRCEGELQALDLAAARLQLLRQGIQPQQLREPSDAAAGRRLRSGELALFLRLLATLIAAGLSLVPALQLCAAQARPTLRAVLRALQADIESGSSFAEALAAHPRVFDALLVSMIAAAERSGALVEVLQQLAGDREKAERLRRKLLKALSYPAAVVLVALLVCFGLLRFAVPQFEALYHSFGGELPAYTRAVLGLADGVQRAGLPLLALMVLAGIALRHRLQHSVAWRRGLDVRLLRLPLFGSLLRRAALARLASSLATLLTAGIPLAEALRSAAPTSGNLAYGEAVERLREKVLHGQLLHEAMQAEALFPLLAVQMLQIGESSGTLETMAARLAERYEEELDLQIESLSKLLEPLLMLILGIMVGSLVLAMYLPIFRLGQAL